MSADKPTGREELIAGWLDHALDPADKARFEAELARDPALAAQVAAWRDNDALLREAFSAPIRQGVDDALLRRMNLERPVPRLVASRPDPAPEVRAANDNPRWRTWLRPRLAVPLGGLVAAGLALAVLLPGQPSAGQDALSLAMTQLPSGEARALPDGSLVTPALSFAAADGRFCREFAISGRAAATGIACKGANGWSVEARSEGAATTADPGRIGVASGRDGTGLDAAYARLGAGDPLSAADERALIAAGWARPNASKRGRE